MQSVPLKVSCNVSSPDFPSAPSQRFLTSIQKSRSQCQRQLPEKIEAIALLFECPGRSIVFQCKPLGTCLKLVKSSPVFDLEKNAYEQLDTSNGNASELFLPIYFFCELAGESVSWKGYFMKQVSLLVQSFGPFTLIKS